MKYGITVKFGNIETTGHEEESYTIVETELGKDAAIRKGCEKVANCFGRNLIEEFIHANVSWTINQIPHVDTFEEKVERTCMDDSPWYAKRAFLKNLNEQIYSMAEEMIDLVSHDKFDILTGANLPGYSEILCIVYLALVKYGDECFWTK